MPPHPDSAARTHRPRGPSGAARGSEALFHPENHRVFRTILPRSSLRVDGKRDLDIPHRNYRRESRQDRTLNICLETAVMTEKLRRAVAGAAIVLALAAASAHAAGITLNETGSTLLYPLFQAWIAGYKSVKPDVEMTAASTGSSAGNKEAIAGSVRIGASDAYLSDQVAAQNPQILDIPLAISAVAINYNLAGLNGAHLKFDGQTLAAIYTGAITEWDDPAIKAMNPS